MPRGGRVCRYSLSCRAALTYREEEIVRFTTLLLIPIMAIPHVPEAPDPVVTLDDPLVQAINYQERVEDFIERVKARVEARKERRQEARQASRAAERQAVSTSALPYGLQRVRSCESGPWRDGTCGYDLSLYNYNAYNATGCEGQGCYGAYQMHASYMADWAREAGYPEYAYVGFWPPAVQDAVALYKWNATGGGLWCDWADYC